MCSACAVAAELGVGTPTVYWHVGNRDELFNRLIEEITDQIREDRAPWPNTGGAHHMNFQRSLARGAGPPSTRRPFEDTGPR